MNRANQSARARELGSPLGEGRRRIAPGQVEQQNRLADQALQATAEVSLPGLAAVLRADYATLRVERIGTAPEQLPSGLVAFALSGADPDAPARAVLGLPRSAARRLVDAALGRPSRNGTEELTSGEQGALLFLFDRAGGDWLDCGASAFVVRGLLAFREQVSAFLGRHPRWQVGGRLATDRLQTPVWLWCDAPSSRHALRPAPRLTSAALHWPVPWSIIAGESTICARELEGLGPGDVLILDRGGHPECSAPHEPGWIRSGRHLCAGRWLDRRRLELLSIDERRSEMDPKEHGVVAGRLDAAGLRGAAGMEVVLRAEVGRVTLKLEQALTLVPGRVVELDREVGTRVQLMAGEQLVASGELVESGGRLAVEITEVP